MFWCGVECSFFFTTLLQSNVGGVGTLGTGEMAYSRGFLSYSYHRLLSH